MKAYTFTITALLVFLLLPGVAVRADDRPHCILRLSDKAFRTTAFQEATAALKIDLKLVEMPVENIVVSFQDDGVHASATVDAPGPYNPPVSFVATASFVEANRAELVLKSLTVLGFVQAHKLIGMFKKSIQKAFDAAKFSQYLTIDPPVQKMIDGKKAWTIPLNANLETFYQNIGPATLTGFDVKEGMVELTVHLDTSAE